MKTSKCFLWSAVCLTFTGFLFGSEASAQTLVVEEEIVEVQPVHGTKYYSKRARDNWFMSVGAGMQTYMHSNHHGALMYNVALDVAGGKWISPYLAIRLNAMGGEVRNRWPTLDDRQSARYVAVYGDFLWDITNAIGGYNPRRVVSVRPFVGAGGLFAFKNSMAGYNTYLFPVTAGLNLNFRLCHYVDIFLEGRANIMGNNFSGHRDGRQVESIASLVAGFTFNFGRDRFFAYNPYAEQALRQQLNDRVNTLREELAECQNRPQPKPEEVVVYVPTPAPAETPHCGGSLMAVVRFSLNSAAIAPAEMVNIYNVAQYMKEHKECTLVVTGYADEDTGTPQYNEALSRRRAQAVVDVLNKQYALPKERIEMVAGGSATQPYPHDNNWNRIVVFSTK